MTSKDLQKNPEMIVRIFPEFPYYLRKTRTFQNSKVLYSSIQGFPFLSLKECTQPPQKDLRDHFVFHLGIIVLEYHSYWNIFRILGSAR